MGSCRPALVSLLAESCAATTRHGRAGAAHTMDVGPHISVSNLPRPPRVSCARPSRITFALHYRCPYPKSRLHHRSRVALLAAVAAHRLPRVAPKPNAALRRRYGVLVVLCAFQLSRIVYFKHSLSSYQVTPPAVLCSAAWRTRPSAPCVPRASAATTKRAAAAAGGAHRCCSRR